MAANTSEHFFISPANAGSKLGGAPVGAAGGGVRGALCCCAQTGTSVARAASMRVPMHNRRPGRWRFAPGIVIGQLNSFYVTIVTGCGFNNQFAYLQGYLVPVPSR